MSVVLLSASSVPQTFPAGTTDPGFTFTVTGTLADGITAFTASQATGTFSLAPGTYTGVVSKLGVASKPSLPLVVSAPTEVTFQVPDSASPATLVVTSP